VINGMRRNVDRRSAGRRTCTSGTLSTINPTFRALELNPCLCIEMLETNHLSYGVASLSSVILSSMKLSRHIKGIFSV
jgi:hypothetical protein